MYPCRPLAVGASALVAAIPATPAFADEIDSGTEAIVVTATRQAMRTNELLSDVTVIDRGSIEASGQETISDLLARQPGIQMSSSGGPGTTTSFYIRGARPEQTKVLVDGVQLNSVDLSGSPLRFLSLADVERIEILRGPASALYGADAIGGVIQIFTRTGAPGLKADAFAGYGTDNTWQANAGLSGGNEQWRFRIEGNHAASDGFSAQKHASNQDADKDGYRNSGGGVSLSFLPAAGHELGFRFRQNAGTTHYDSGNTPADGNFDDRVDFETQQWQVFARNRLSDVWTSKLLYGETVDEQKSYASWALDGELLRTKNRQATWQNDVRLPLGTALLALEHLEQTASPGGIAGTAHRFADRRLDGEPWQASLATEHAPRRSLRIRRPADLRAGLRLPADRGAARAGELRDGLQGAEPLPALLVVVRQREPQAGGGEEPRSGGGLGARLAIGVGNVVPEQG